MTQAQGAGRRRLGLPVPGAPGFAVDAQIACDLGDRVVYSNASRTAGPGCPEGTCAVLASTVIFLPRQPRS